MLRFMHYLARQRRYIAIGKSKICAKASWIAYPEISICAARRHGQRASWAINRRINALTSQKEHKNICRTLTQNCQRAVKVQTHVDNTVVVSTKITNASPFDLDNTSSTRSKTRSAIRSCYSLRKNSNNIFFTALSMCHTFYVMFGLQLAAPRSLFFR